MVSKAEFFVACKLVAVIQGGTTFKTKKDPETGMLASTCLALATGVPKFGASALAPGTLPAVARGMAAQAPVSTSAPEPPSVAANPDANAASTAVSKSTPFVADEQLARYACCIRTDPVARFAASALRRWSSAVLTNGLHRC